MAEPGNPQALNRYAYVNNNPLKYTDPSGHWLETAWDIANIAWDIYEVRRDPSLLNIGALVVDVGTALLPGVPAFAGVVSKGGKAAKAAVEVASHADETKYLVDSARVGERLVQRLAQIGMHADEGRLIIKELAGLSTQGPRSGVVVLGRFRPEPGYKSYIEKAREMGATYFSMPSSPGYDVWDALRTAGIDPWEVNKQFLDDAIARGDKFFVEANIDEILINPKFANTYLRRELEYLLSKGYRMEGNWFVPGG